MEQVALSGGQSGSECVEYSRIHVSSIRAMATMVIESINIFLFLILIIVGYILQK